MFKHLLPPEDFNTLSIQEKLDSIIERMHGIYKEENMRFWRGRFASEEQFKQEYPADYHTNLTAIFMLVKNNYTENFDEINEIAHKYVDNGDLLRILKSIVEKDVEGILLGEEDEREEV